MADSGLTDVSTPEPSTQPVAVPQAQPTPATYPRPSGPQPYPQPGVVQQQPGYSPQIAGVLTQPGQQGYAYHPGVPLGYNPAMHVAGASGALAQNLPPQQVTWMPPPENAPTGCPPGLEYLTQIDQVLVHQQIEVFEMVTNFEMENKYRIRNTLGQQIYFAAEIVPASDPVLEVDNTVFLLTLLLHSESSVFQRQCCGPGRQFAMSIADNSNREVIHLERPLRCYYNCNGLTCYCCCSCCLPHVIEVQAPPGTVVGYVKQEALGILRPWFSIQNADGETVLRIRGPTLGCSCYSDANFNVVSADGTQDVGTISKQWGGIVKEYLTDADNFGIKFPVDLDVKMKAVMIGAVFLIDFMFFEQQGAGGARQHVH